MRVPFRQGIITAPDNFLTLTNRHVSINLQDSEGRVDVTIADGDTNYLVSETRSVNNAWVGAYLPGIDYWLYWDIDTTTGALTRGHTLVEPVSGNSEPVNPANGTHWFDTVRGRMFVYQATTGKWIHVLRAFACQLYNGTQIISIGANSPSFVGTQVGVVGDVLAGALVFDMTGAALKRGDGKFFTTEDTIVAGVGVGARVKMESVLVTAKATASIPAYSLVRFVDAGEIAPATNLMLDPGIYGLVDHAVAEGETTEIIREGYITNPTGSWDFSSVPINTAVFVDSHGQVTLTPQAGSRAVGMVMDVETIVLLSTTVADVTLLQSAVTINGPQSGVIVAGVGGQTSGQFNITLEGNLAAIDNISTAGFARRVSDDIWTASLVNVNTDVTGILPPANGGTGTGALSGYVFAPAAGAPFTASTTIPAVAIVGDISGKSAGITGILDVINGGTGAITRNEALNNLLPPQTTSGVVLTSDGTNATWNTIPDGTVRSVGISTGPGLSAVNTPITSAGNISLSLTGNVASLYSLMTTGLLSRSAGGAIQTNEIKTPLNSLNISNGNASMSGDITIDLPVLNAPSTYASVVVDEFGRVTSGTTNLDWSRVDTTPRTVAGYGIIDAYTKTEIDALTWNWAAVTNRATTLAGYGITDAYTKAETDALSWDWSRIMSTPATMAGYGIADGIVGSGVYSITLGASVNKPQAGIAGRVYIDTTDNTLTVDNGASWSHIGNAGTVTSIDVSSLNSDVVITGGPVTTTGTINMDLAGNLAAISAVATPGLAVRKADGTWHTSYVVGTSNNTVISNGDGNGNVVVDLANVGTPGTYMTVNTDSKGRVISGSATASWNGIVDRPTTVEGYGITNAVTSAMLAAASGVATLDATGKIPTSQLPALAITDTFVVNSATEMQSLIAEQGDMAIRLDENKTYILTNNNPYLLSSWQEVLTAAAGGGVGVTHVGAQSSNSNLVVSGGPILDSGTLQFSLTGNLSSVSGVTGAGVVKRDGSGNWSTTTVTPSDIAGTIDVAKGGTGVNTLTGYVKGNGTNPLYAVATIPGTDVTGNISGNASNVTDVVAIANGGTGATTQSDALANILPVQTAPSVLSSDGTTASWMTSIPGAMISGAVANASSALNSAALGGLHWSYFAATDGTNATGTWNVDTNGTAGNVTGVVAVANGGTGATAGPSACDNIGAAHVDHTHSEYALVVHSHTNYAETNHTHSQYSLTTHTHPDAPSKAVAAVFNEYSDSVAVVAHCGAYVRITSATPNTFTLDTDSNTIPTIPVNSVITVRQTGTGTTTIVGASGVTLNSPGTASLRAQHSTVQLIKVGADEWDIVGDVTL